MEKRFINCDLTPDGNDPETVTAEIHASASGLDAYYAISLIMESFDIDIKNLITILTKLNKNKDSRITGSP